MPKRVLIWAEGHRKSITLKSVVIAICAWWFSVAGNWLASGSVRKFPEHTGFMHVDEVAVGLLAGTAHFFMLSYKQRVLLAARSHKMTHLALLATETTLAHIWTTTESVAGKIGEHHAIPNLERTFDLVVEALGQALDLKDAESEGHSQRVTAYSILLGHRMGISRYELEAIGRGAFLHDIGKVSVPDEILNKPGKLDSKEREYMEAHAAAGARILVNIPFLEDAAQIVLSHHERWDGTGYPRKLKGTEIPLGARIFAIADTLDAITSHRIYRHARSFAAAREEIERCSGTQFDPEIVETFLEISDGVWELLRRDLS